MIKRFIRLSKEDRKLIYWLFRGWVKALLKRDRDDAYMIRFMLVLHLTHDFYGFDPNDPDDINNPNHPDCPYKSQLVNN